MHVLGFTLLCAAFISLIIYLIALRQLVSQPRHRGLVRTAVCRVVGAMLYMVVGAFSAVGDDRAGTVAVGMFIVLQFMWWINSLADVRITRLENRSQVIYRRGMRKAINMAPYHEEDPYIASEALATPEDIASDPYEQLRKTVGTNTQTITSVKNAQESIQTRTLVFGAVAGTAFLIGIISLILAVVVDNRSRENTSQLDGLHATQVQMATDLHGLCDLAAAQMAFYNDAAKNRYPGGVAAYDQIYINLQKTSDARHCNIPHVVPGT